MNSATQNGRRNAQLQLGVTLVELMIAMTIALAIVAGVAYVYVQGKQGFRVQDAQSRLQENSRLAFSMISRDLMMAGHFGCVKSTVDVFGGQPNIRITAAPPLLTDDIGWLETDRDASNQLRRLDPSNAVRGYDSGATWSSSVPATISSKRLAGTDSIVILRGGDEARHLSSAMEDEFKFKINSALPGVTTNGRLAALVISNCASGEIVKPTVGGGGTSFTTENKFNRNTKAKVEDPVNDNDGIRMYEQLGIQAMVTTFEPVSYFIGLSTGSNNEEVPSLFRLTTMVSPTSDNNAGRWDLSPDVVIQGVEGLQFRYVRAGLGGNLETASQIDAANAWADVVAVQVQMTFVSDSDAVRTVSTTQTVDGKSVTDSRLRLRSSFVVNLRNPRQL